MSTVAPQARITNRDLFALTLRYAMESDLEIERYAKYKGEKTPSLFGDDDKPSWIQVGAAGGHGGHPVQIEKKSGKMITGHFAGMTLADAFGPAGEKHVEDHKKPEGIKANDKSPLFDKKPDATVAKKSHAQLMREQAKQDEQDNPAYHASEWMDTDADTDDAHRKLMKSDPKYRELDGEADGEIEAGDFDETKPDGPHEKARQKYLVESMHKQNPHLVPDYAKKHYGLGEHANSAGDAPSGPIPYRDRNKFASDMLASGKSKEEIEAAMIKRGVAISDARSHSSRALGDAAQTSKVERVTNDQFEKDGWDTTHEGLASKMVQSRMVEGMKGIDNREYGMMERDSGKWQMVSKPSGKPKPDYAQRLKDMEQRKDPEGIVKPSDKVANADAKEGDQLGLFGEAVKQPKPFKPMLLDNAIKAKQGGLFDTKGNADQMDLFGDGGVMPEDLVYKPEKAYDDFKREYGDAFKESMKYKPNEVGAGHFAQKMADLADKHPEHLEKLEEEQDAEQAKKSRSSTYFKGDKAAFTGKKDADGFHELEMLDGYRKGKKSYVSYGPGGSPGPGESNTPRNPNAPSFKPKMLDQKNSESIAKPDQAIVSPFDGAKYSWEPMLIERYKNESTQLGFAFADHGFDEAKHHRKQKGSAGGGQFTSIASGHSVPQGGPVQVGSKTYQPGDFIHSHELSALRPGKGDDESVKASKALLSERHKSSLGERKLPEREIRRSDGTPLSDEQQAGLALLKTRPDLTDMRLHQTEHGDWKVTGKDSKGRDQTAYPPAQEARRAAGKAERLPRFLKHRNDLIRPKVLKDIANGTPSEKEGGWLAFLMDYTGMRIGSEKDTGADIEATGATTLDASQVAFDGDSVIMEFIGKSGHHNTWTLKDAGFAEEMRSRVARGGKVFQMKDTQFRRYMNGIAPDFKPAKDFRMAVANEHAIEVIKTLPVPQTPDEYRSAIGTVATSVANRINNTPDVAFSSYILPEVFSSWQATLLRNGHTNQTLKPSYSKETPTQEPKQSKPRKAKIGGSSTRTEIHSSPTTIQKTTNQYSWGGCRFHPMLIEQYARLKSGRGQGHFDIEGYSQPAKPFVYDGDLLYDPARERYANDIYVAMIERYEWTESQHARDGKGTHTGGQFTSGGATSGATNATQRQASPKFSKSRELADHPTLQSHHSLHINNQDQKTKTKLSDHAKGFRNLLENATRAAQFKRDDPHYSPSEEDVWASVDKNALRTMLAKVNAANHESMKGDGPKLHELMNANQVIPKMIAERLHGGFRFFDPEKLRGRWNEKAPSPEAEAAAPPAHEHESNQTESPANLPQTDSEPPAKPVKPKRDPITADSLRGAFSEKLPEGITRAMSTKLEKRIKATVGDDPEIVKAFKPIVFSAWKQLTEEANDHNQAIRTITNTAASLYDSIGHNSKSVSGTPQKLTALVRLARSGQLDPSKKKNFDIMVDSAQRTYPQYVGGRGEDGVIDWLSEGIKPQPNLLDAEVGERAVTLAGADFFRQFDQAEEPEQDQEQQQQASGDDWQDQFSWSVARVMVERYRNDPTPAQRTAGTFKTQHIRVHGLPISVETKKGEKRRTDSPSLAADYGYFRNTLGKDGDHIDAFVGPNKSSEMVFVIDQAGLNGKFDEHKVMMGFNNQVDAVTAYRKSRPNNWKVGPVTAMTIRQFKNWLASGKHAKAIGGQVSRYSGRQFT